MGQYKAAMRACVSILLCLSGTSSVLATPVRHQNEPRITLPAIAALIPAFEDRAIDFSSALHIEASFRRNLAQLSSVPALPMPTNVKNMPEYSALAKLANAPLPPIQAGVGLAETKEAIANIFAEANRSSPHIAPRQNGLRVMIVGDSITNGQEGDFTWRYRIWQWFQAQGIAVNMVGPYKGTFQSASALASGPQQPPQPPPLYGSTPSQSSTDNLNGGYASGMSSSFSNAHFSVWGRALAVDQGLIQNVLQNNPADMILLALGFNDMGWFYSDCYGTINSLQKFINNARAVNPNIKIAVANVPQRTFIRPDLTSNITTYNKILPDYIAQWSTDQSPIRLVEFQQNYACGTTSCPGGYDGLHPNAWGEFQIANAFTKSLISGFGLGSQPLAIPAQNDASLARPIGTPSNFQVFASPQGVTATWDKVYGAYSYDVDVSINGGGAGFSPGSTSVNRWDSQWPLAGWQYSVRVRASCGDQKGAWTSALSATAAPQLPSAPENVKVSPTADGFTVSWSPPVNNSGNIVEYNVIYWDTEPSDCQYVAGAAFKGTSATLTGLMKGRSYLVAPVAWNQYGQGLPNIAHNVIPGAGTPPVPSNLQAISNDGTTVHLSWTGSAAAAGYEVFIRNATAKGPFTSYGNVSASCQDSYFLFPGTWTYEFCVAAYNGNLQSTQGSPVVPPRPSGSATNVQCPAAPVWCPAGSGGGGGGYVGGGSGEGGDGCPVGGCKKSTTNPSSVSSQPSSQSTNQPPCPTGAQGYTPDLWTKYQMGDWLQSNADPNNAEIPVIRAMLQKLSNYQCRWGGCDTSSITYDVCQSNPRAAFALYALTQFGQYLNDVSDHISKSTIYLGDKGDKMVQDFYPLPSQDSSAATASSVLGIVGAVVGLIPNVGGPAAAGLSVAGGLLGIFGKSDPPNQNLDRANIKSGFADTFRASEKALISYFNTSLYQPLGDVNNAGNVVQTLKPGTFAYNMSLNPWAAQDQIQASLGSTAINYLWGKQKILIAKATTTSLGFDPCGNDRLFPGSVKYCDGGAMYVLQSVNSTANTYGNQITGNAVPGFQTLGDYSITSPAPIIMASKDSQDRGGYGAAPLSPSDLAGVFKSLNQSPPLGKLVQFNLPICDLDAVNIANQDQLINQCATGKGQDGLDACKFNIRMYCGCVRQKDKNGKDFPFETYTGAKMCLVKTVCNPNTSGTANCT